jgi:hypothetical protein
MQPTQKSDLLVTRVDRFSADSESASVTLASGLGDVVAFSCPCDAVVGARVPNLLSVLEAPVLQAPCLNDWPAEERERLSLDRLERTGQFSYVGCGAVLDPSEGLMLARGFLLDFGEVPAGAEHVEFEITRLDFG